MTHSFDKDYWDQIWHGDRAAAMAAGEPNPHLVREVADLAPGTALEAGCGAGTEAIWLAARGWQVTAADIAAQALARGAERASAGGVAERIQWVEADLSTWEPEARYDLVTTHYAHPAIPQLEFYDRIANWVAPGGTLLIVAHLGDHGSDAGHGGAHGQGGPDGHGDPSTHGDSHGHEHGHSPAGDGPPASALVTTSDIAARLDPAAWEIHTAEESTRTLAGPGGREVTIHDAVVRATRRA